MKSRWSHATAQRRPARQDTRGGTKVAERLFPCTAVQGSVLDGLGEVIGADCLVALEVGDRASHLKDPVVCPRRQPQPLDRGLEEALPVGPDGAGSTELPGTHLGVAEGLGPPEPIMLDRPGPLHPRPHRLGWLPLRLRRKLPIAQRRDIDMQVDPVEEGARDPGPVTVDLGRGTGALAPRISEVAAGTPM